MVCTFAGHRPEKLPWHNDETDPRCVALKVQIARAVEAAWHDGFTEFLCGMARGCDFYFFDAVAQLRERAPNIYIEAILPCRSQSERWSEANQRRYRDALAACDLVIYNESEYSEGCMLRRNYAMIDRAQRIITVYDGSGGGTGSAVLYAGRHGVEIKPIWL
jgi:uncharacterized phage-like protein YoqJ